MTVPDVTPIAVHKRRILNIGRLVDLSLTASTACSAAANPKKGRRAYGEGVLLSQYDAYRNTRWFVLTLGLSVGELER